MEVKFIKHAQCSNKLLSKIALLKMQHWGYSVNEQIIWLNENISSNDIHLCLLVDNALIAYASISNIQYMLKNKIIKRAFGIGSVCVDKNHLNKQFGFIITQLAVLFIKQQYTIGFLLCKDDLVSFYEKSNWFKFNGELIIPNISNDINLLSTEKLSDSQKVYISKIF